MLQIDFFDHKKLIQSGENLQISFSGGRTSGYMTYHVQKYYRKFWKNVVTMFSNTSRETEECLEFVHRCDLDFNFNTVWLEAVIHPGKGNGTTHKVVDYYTACRDGSVFERAIEKYGIPNVEWMSCTRELKQHTMESYARSLGWGTDYTTCIGIRPDEDRRVNPKATEQKIVYPLIDWLYADKQDVNDWWEDQKFNLPLQEHQGNCKCCYKKSDRKLAMTYHENPEFFDWTNLMEEKYGFVGPEFDLHGVTAPRVMFRQKRSTKDMIQFFNITDIGKMRNRPEDNSGCTLSCELYPTISVDEFQLVSQEGKLIGDRCK